MLRTVKVIFSLILFSGLLLFLAGCSQEQEDLDDLQEQAKQQIVYTLYEAEDGDTEIFLMDESGNILQQLTDNSFSDESPVFSPDGSKIAFISKRDYAGDILYDAVYLMDADGNGTERVSDLYYDIHDGLTWSPDGSLLAFGARVADTDDYDIYKLKVGDGSALNLTGISTYDETYPSWSPDGDRIVFVSDRNGSDDLFLMDSSGDLINNITVTQGNFHALYPAWSPDGDRIVFVEEYLQVTPFEWYTNIMVVDMYGEISYVTEGIEYIKIYPTWRPDSSGISFVSDMDGNLNLYSIDIQGNNPVQLTDFSSPDWCSGHSWKPN